MPYSPDPLSMSVAASQVGIAGLNAVLTGKTNRKNRKFAEKMANQSRAWAIEDWNAQNAYNTPAAQMQRFKEAGLNPHLIYGQNNEAAAVRSTDSAKYENVAPQLDFDPSSLVSNYNQTRLADVNTDNAKLQGEILRKEAKLVDAKILDTMASAGQKGVDTDFKTFQLGLESELRDSSLQFRQGMVRKQESEIGKTLADTKFTLDHNQREQIKQTSDLRQAVATLASTYANTAKTDAERQRIKQEVRNLHLDESIKADDLRLRSLNLTPNSSIYQKTVAQHLEKIIGVYRKAEKFRNDWWNLKAPKKYSFNK